MRTQAMLVSTVVGFLPVTYVATALVLALAATLACWVPARRATRIDPREALRAVP